MSTFGKILIGLVIGLLIAGAAGIAVLYGVIRIGGEVVADTANTNPADVAKVANQIADFDLPEGYQPEYAMDLGIFTVAAYNPGDGHSHLTFIQGPKGLAIDDASIKETLSSSTTGTKDETTRMTVVEQRQATVRGQETTLIVSEGTNHEGETFREISAAFQGKNGPAFLVIEEPVSRWDDARINEFIASIQ